MFNVSGIDLRIARGEKVAGDLRLDAWVNGRWVPLRMELAFFLVDFFTENEQVISDNRSWWRQNGERYFLSKCVEAVRRGWRSVADELDEQRRRRPS